MYHPFVSIVFLIINFLCRKGGFFAGGGAPGSGRTATAGQTIPAPSSGRSATAGPTPLSDIIPGQGEPTVDEMAQWKEGTLARYPCCHRVQPCGLIYCLFCTAKLLVKWSRVKEMDAGQAAAAAEPSDAREEAARLQKAARPIMYGRSTGRSNESDFTRRVIAALKYRQKWINKSLEDVTADAAKGKCSEVPGTNVVPPWEPANVTSWHPRLMDALRAKMHETRQIDQEELDAKYLVSAVVRTLDARGQYTLPSAETPAGKAERKRMILLRESGRLCRMRDRRLQF